MNKVISFLEELGKSAAVKLDGLNLEALIENDDFDPEVKQAILSGDQNAVEMILNARSKIVCLLVPAEDDEDEDDSEEETESDSAIRSQVRTA